VKALSVARKTLVELLREPLLLGLAFVFPVVLVALYYVAFGETDEGLAKYLPVWVVDADAGVRLPGGRYWQAGVDLIGVLRSAEWEGRPVFAVTVVGDRREAVISLRERKLALLLVIPPHFSQALVGAPAGGPPAEVSLVGDPASDNYVFARNFLDDVVRRFGQRAAGLEETSPVVYEFVPGTGTMSDFDFGVPGVIVFGIVLVSVTTAETLVREEVGGTLRRLRLSCVHALDLLLGVTLAQMAVALFIVPLTFATATAFGFRGNGSLLLGMGIGGLFSLAAVGIGLVTACFARTDSEAANLGAVVGVLMVLLSGAMYPMPEAPLFTIAGRSIQIYDLVPAAHAAEAMRRVLVLGDGPAEIAFELVALTLLSLLLLVIGVVLYQRLRLRNV
jgi:ABC-type multidrug transport system permease subunit